MCAVSDNCPQTLLVITRHRLHDVIVPRPVPSMLRFYAVQIFSNLSAKLEATQVTSAASKQASRRAIPVSVLSAWTLYDAHTVHADVTASFTNGCLSNSLLRQEII